jgi:hypothetical protein
VFTFTGTDTLRIAGGQLVSWRTPTACCSFSNSAFGKYPVEHDRPPDGPTIFARPDSPAGSPAWEDPLDESRCDPPPGLSRRWYLLAAPL